MALPLIYNEHLVGSSETSNPRCEMTVWALFIYDGQYHLLVIGGCQSNNAYMPGLPTARYIRAKCECNNGFMDGEIYGPFSKKEHCRMFVFDSLAFEDLMKNTGL